MDQLLLDSKDNADTNDPPRQSSGGLHWMLSSIPANVATGPLSTLVTLLLLAVGGDVLNVAYAITIASAITVPAVFFWGLVTDIIDKRKAFIVFSYIATSFLMLSLFAIHSTIGITIVYALIAFVGAATAAPINLLVMETGAKQNWTHNFAILQMLTSVGTTLGLIVSWIITGFLDLEILVLVLATSSFASAALAAKLIIEPSLSKRRRSLNDQIHTFLYRLAAVPVLLIRIPNPRHIRNLFKFSGLAGHEKRFILIFYVISFIFFFGTSVFNTEYPASLNIYGLGSSAIFFVILAGMVVQTLVFYYYDRMTKGLNKRSTSVLSLGMRGGSYLMIGLIFLFLKGWLFDLGNIVFYATAAGLAYALYYPASYRIFFGTLAGKGKGSAIGIYTGIVGVGTLLGALVSGGAAVTYGFGVTFMIAAAMMLLCSYMFVILPG